MSKILIVAEIGCNHNGDIDLAEQMIHEAKKCGVDAVKFQTFNSEALISRYAEKAEYQKKTTGDNDNQLEMTRKLELSKEDYIYLKKIAEEEGLIVFSTPFDLDSIKFLYEQKQKIWKIPSGEITNLPYLESISNLDIEGKIIILSTGMSNVEEIDTALDILGKKDKIVILHCNTEYPTPDEDVNLKAIDFLKRYYSDYEIGFSDHSVGEIAAIGAATKDISMIEKHFTLDKSLPGPDHMASATPDELAKICQGVRRVEKMLGKEEKSVTNSEKKNKAIARKSIVALKEIRAGEVFTEGNITCKRPGNGISPMEWYNVIGKKAEKDFVADELILLTGFKWQES